MKTLFSIAIATVSVIVTGYAQKLPNVQKESVRAPANIKIDGKATEWDNKFKAQNNATELFYTLSNDDENLYLAVQTKFKDVIDKIMRGGITFTVNPTLDKKNTSQASVTYPSLDLAGVSNVTNKMAVKNSPKANPDEDPVSVNDVNKTFSMRSKVVAVSGINSIQSGEISIYNENGIQVASHFDDNLGYTYELAIPLKHLSLPDSSKPFSYQIKVNEPKQFTKLEGNRPPPPMMKTSVAATDTWGEYTLAKK
jgi:hypothetical protein